MPLAGLGETFLSLEWVSKSLGAWVGVEAMATLPGCSMAWAVPEQACLISGGKKARG